LYTSFYRLLERPFELTPDPRYLYLSERHREALLHLTYGVQERKGFVQLTGEVGTGKTTMLDALVCGLDAGTKVARLSHTTIGEAELVRWLAGELGVDVSGPSKMEALAALEARLKKWSADGSNVVFVVDEGQNLSLPVLEEIRLLSNLRVDGRAGLQIVLAGQPELREKLERVELRQLRQRIGVRYHLTPLSKHETREYVVHRLSVAGAQEEIFDPGAVEEIYAYSRGVPRVINTLCDRALLAGYAAGKRRVTRSLVLESIDSIEGGASSSGAGAPRETGGRRALPRPAGRGGSSSPRWAFPALAAGLMVTIGLVALGVVWGQRSHSDGVPGGGVAVAAAEAPGRSATGAATADSVNGDQTPSRQVASGEVEAMGGGGPELAAGSPDSFEVGSVLRGAGDATRSLPGREMPGPPVPESERPGGSYRIVVLSSRSEQAARAELAKLSVEGVSGRVERADLARRGVWFRVMLAGAFATRDEAAEALARVREIGYTDAWILARR